MTHWKIRCAHFRKIITQVIFFCELQRLPPTEEKDLFFRGTLPDITTANRHDSVVLHCKVGGREPTIHWLKDGVRIQQVRDIELIWAQHSGWKFSLKSNFIFKKKIIIIFYFNFLCVLSVLKYIYLKKKYHFIIFRVKAETTEMTRRNMRTLRLWRESPLRHPSYI